MWFRFTRAEGSGHYSAVLADTLLQCREQCLQKVGDSACMANRGTGSDFRKGNQRVCSDYHTAKLGKLIPGW